MDNFGQVKTSVCDLTYDIERLELAIIQYHRPEIATIGNPIVTWSGCGSFYMG
jgi:hypothetical protein